MALHDTKKNNGYHFLFIVILTCLTIKHRRQEAGSYQARAAGPPSLASRPTARPVQAVSADIQGAAWTGTVVHRQP